VRELRQSPHSPNPYIPVVMVTGPYRTPPRGDRARDAGVTEIPRQGRSRRRNLIARITEVVERPPRLRAGSQTYFRTRPAAARATENYVGPFRRTADREADMVEV